MKSLAIDKIKKGKAYLLIGYGRGGTMNKQPLYEITILRISPISIQFKVNYPEADKGYTSSLRFSSFKKRWWLRYII